MVGRGPGFALPFVTRSLRRRRGRRYLALSLGLALFTLLSCLWIGLGRGEAARDIRSEIGLEMARHEREWHDFVVIRMPDEPWANEAARRDFAIERARATVRLAAELTRYEGHEELHARARALADTWPPPAVEHGSTFAWCRPHEVRRLEKIIDRGGIPEIVDYGRPDFRGTLQLLGLVTGGLLIVLLTVVAPLLVGVQQAVERHENTLQPLAGTGLSARALVVGLACGPLAIVAIFAAPLAVLFVTAVVGTGQLQAAWVLPVVIATAIGLVFGAQLLAHLLGPRLPPVLIAVGLFGLLGLVGLLGFVIAYDSVHETGRVALSPSAGAFALLALEFGDPWLDDSRFQHASDATQTWLRASTGVGTGGAALLGLLALQALARHLEGRRVLLEFGHALLGAGACVVLVAFAIESTDEVPLAPAMLALPFLLLIMARVPVGDVPTRMRVIPFVRLLGEFAGWMLLGVTASALVGPTDRALHPIMLFDVAWSVLVLVLLAVRFVATPGTFLAHAWSLVCVGMLAAMYRLAIEHAFFGVFVSDTGQLLLVLVLLTSTVWVPLSLFVHLYRHVRRVD